MSPSSCLQVEEFVGGNNIIGVLFLSILHPSVSTVECTIVFNQIPVMKLNHELEIRQITQKLFFH